MKYPAEVFVETGTYDGSGIALALDCGFREIHSIEIDPARHAYSSDRFAGATNVRIYKGDSIDVLPAVMRKLDKKATLWLDAHPIGPADPCPRGKAEWPLVSELRELAHSSFRKDHTILIDDRECFKTLFGTSDQELQGLLLKINRRYVFSYEPNKMRAGDILVARVSS